MSPERIAELLARAENAIVELRAGLTSIEDDRDLSAADVAKQLELTKSQARRRMHGTGRAYYLGGQVHIKARDAQLLNGRS